MYYLICLLVYLFLLFWFINYIKKPSKKEKKKYKEVLYIEAIKGLTKSDVKSRKRRVKVLPLWQRFLYWLWFSSIIALIVVPTLMLCIVRNYITKAFFVLENAIYFECSSLSYLMFGIGSFLCGISLLVVYSYITNRGVIRQADLLYKLGSFQEYPKKINILICGILFIMGFPIMFLSFNSYKYITNEKVVIKSPLSISQKEYSYEDIDYVVKKIYVDEDCDYIMMLNNGKKLTTFEGNTEENILFTTLSSHKIEYKTEYVKPLLS